MGFAPIISTALGAMWFLIPLAILAAIIKSPWFKGFIGEAMVNLAAKLSLNKDDYHLIKNVTLPTEDGTTQIDHVIVSRFGLFVVETKNMKGWIFGSANQKSWTQKIFKHTSKFQNPLHQNYKHLHTLKSALELTDDQIHSVIVFVGDSTFKIDMPENVTKGQGYIRYIKSKSDVVISDEQVKLIVSKIESERLTPSFATNREHVKHVKEIVKNKSVDKSCPKCGTPMILRTAKSGKNAGNKFWGCRSFPKCRGVRTA